MKFPILFLFGAFVYGALEVIFKQGDTHVSMFLLGGLCFLLLGAMSPRMSLLSRMTAGALLITALELAVGVIVNVILNLGVWDYSYMPFNFMGQICLLFTGFWFGLSLVGFLLDGWLKHRLFNAEKPQYRIMPRLPIKRKEIA
ncbi:MAG: putative ABC transporter permease [Oscillospiraceae bacterium]|nr:putative ABC transporter permease [Oscillospiraceae bacterium]